MGIQLELYQVTSELLDSMRRDEKLTLRILRRIRGKSLPLTSPKRFYAAQGIHSVEEYIAHNPYILNLEPERKKEAMKRLTNTFRKNQKGVGESLSLEKSWHGLHFLIAGGDCADDDVASRAIIGAESLSETAGFHDSAMVKRIAEALPPLAEIPNWYDPSEMAAAGIYAFCDDDPEGELEYLSGFYEKLLHFFQRSAESDQAILLLMS